MTNSNVSPITGRGYGELVKNVPFNCLLFKEFYLEQTTSVAIDLLIFEKFTPSFSQLIQSWQKWQYWHQMIKQQQKITSSGALPDARDYYWFRSPMLNQLS